LTGHVAQGATVERCFVLASEGMSREWAYVALSRGRLSNRLYVAAEPGRERAEFAPVELDVRDPVERLARALRDSNGQVLAIDCGAVAERDVGAAYRADGAVREREGLERQRFKWLPGRRAELANAREREAAATGAADEARRLTAEVRHGARSFVDEREVAARRDALQRKLADRATERVLQRVRRMGREL
jgi:hypothetical protein